MVNLFIQLKILVVLLIRPGGEKGQVQNSFWFFNWGQADYLLFCDFSTGVRLITKPFCIFLSMKMAQDCINKRQTNYQNILDHGLANY